MVSTWPQKLATIPNWTKGNAIKIKKIKSCLELGTFTGYSTLSMALSLPKNGKIHTIDKDFMKIGSTVFAEIYHPEELEYKKIWANCKVVKKQFFNPQRRYNIPADI